MTNEDVITHQCRVSKITEAILALDRDTANDHFVDYKALYYALFNDLTDVIQELEDERRDTRGTCAKLIHAQQRSETRFLAYP